MLLSLRYDKADEERRDKAAKRAIGRRKRAAEGADDEAATAAAVQSAYDDEADPWTREHTALVLRRRRVRRL